MSLTRHRSCSTFDEKTMKTIITLTIMLLTGLSTSWALPVVESHGKFISVTWKDNQNASLKTKEEQEVELAELTFIFRKEDLISIESEVWPKPNPTSGTLVANPFSVTLFFKPLGDDSKAPTRKFISLSTNEGKDLVIAKILEFSND